MSVGEARSEAPEGVGIGTRCAECRQRGDGSIEGKERARRGAEEPAAPHEHSEPVDWAPHEAGEPGLETPRTSAAPGPASAPRDRGWALWPAFAIALAVAMLVFGLVSVLQGNSMVDWFRPVEGLLLVLAAVVSALEFVACHREGVLARSKSRGYLETTVLGQMGALLVLATLTFTLPVAEATILAITIGVFAVCGARLCAHQHLRTIERALERDAQTKPEDSAREPDAEHHRSLRANLRYAFSYTNRIGSVAAAAFILLGSYGVVVDAEGLSRGFETSSAKKERQEAERKKRELKQKERLRAERLEREHQKAERERKHSGEAQAGAQSSEVGVSTPMKNCEAISGEDASQAIAGRLEHMIEVGPVAATELGCPGTVEHVETSFGTLYWSEARLASGSNPTAVAVLCPGYQRFIALWPAVDDVVQLLREGIPLGAPREIPRYYSGPGSFYLLYSPYGPYVLEQQALEIDGEAVPFIELPPSVSVATKSTDQEIKGWMWVSGPPNPIAGAHYELRSPSTGKREVVRYDGEHWARRGSKGLPYNAIQQNFDIDDLRRWREPISAREQELEAELEGAED